jgi:hypothetical protein
VEDALEPGYAGVHVPPPNLELYRHLLHGSRRIGDSSGTRGERVLRLGFGVWGLGSIASLFSHNPSGKAE